MNPKPSRHCASASPSPSASPSASRSRSRSPAPRPRGDKSRLITVGPICGIALGDVVSGYPDYVKYVLNMDIDAPMGEIRRLAEAPMEPAVRDLLRRGFETAVGVGKYAESKYADVLFDQGYCKWVADTVDDQSAPALAELKAWLADMKRHPEAAYRVLCEVGGRGPEPDTFEEFRGSLIAAFEPFGQKGKLFQDAPHPKTFREILDNHAKEGLWICGAVERDPGNSSVEFCAVAAYLRAADRAMYSTALRRRPAGQPRGKPTLTETFVSSVLASSSIY